MITTIAQDAVRGPAPAAGQAGKSFPGLTNHGRPAAWSGAQEHDNSVYITPGRDRVSDGYDNSMNAHTKTLLDKIAPLDMAFRSLRSHYGKYGTLLYIGIEDPTDPGTADGFDSPAAEAIYKVYPGENMDSYADWGARHAAQGSPKWCDARWTPAPGSTPSDWTTRLAPSDAQHAGTQRQARYYDPRCRGW